MTDRVSLPDDPLGLNPHRSIYARISQARLVSSGDSQRDNRFFDETSTLLSFGLVYKRALFKSRSRLFSTLEFSKDKSFDGFLHLADARWTSFTLVVKEIHLQDMFCCPYVYSNKRNPKRIASNLRHVKSLVTHLVT